MDYVYIYIYIYIYISFLFDHCKISFSLILYSVIMICLKTTVCNFNVISLHSVWIPRKWRRKTRSFNCRIYLSFLLLGKWFRFSGASAWNSGSRIEMNSNKLFASISKGEDIPFDFLRSFYGTFWATFLRGFLK